jgi:nucleoside 2-deoxyribosyltransferase
MQDINLLIIGEIRTDVYLLNNNNYVRLGGVFHAARACHAGNIKYSMCYYAPLYLEHDIQKFSKILGCSTVYSLGIIDRCPSLTIVQNCTEIYDQGYEDILRDQCEIIETNSIKEMLRIASPTDIIIFPGKYNIKGILKDISEYPNIRVHIDLHYDYSNLLELIKTPIETAILSTSSNFFKQICGGTFSQLKKVLNPTICKSILLKENRGGSRYFTHETSELLKIPSFPITTVHSVGVGDCFNCIFVGYRYIFTTENALKLASYCSSIYASTWAHNEFSILIKNFMVSMNILTELKGITLPWESRLEHNIYIAAPDFPDVDTRYIDELEKALRYHNFNPRLPIRENGLVLDSEDIKCINEVYYKDLNLLRDCSLLIAVLLYNDPGTLVELGMFAQTAKPTILFDPYKIADNLFLRKTANYICTTINEVIDKTFICIGRIMNNE